MGGVEALWVVSDKGSDYLYRKYSSQHGGGSFGMGDPIRLAVSLSLFLAPGGKQGG